VPSDYPVGRADSAGCRPRWPTRSSSRPFNDAEAAREIIECYRHELAAVIVEPYQRVIPPQTPGFLQALREATRRTMCC
jgi:glutamate-1-semialdehyde 2,1-aminomutase